MTAVIDVSGVSARLASQRTFLGHPLGLSYIVFTEGWERFSFHGMQALLILYMTGYLLHPGTIEGVIGFAQFRTALEWVFGPLSLQALASQIFGLYIGLVYFSPTIGGSFGDRVMGRTRAVVMGAVLMAMGHFLMALEAAFLFALLLLILGAGLMKGNLAAQVGNLYPKTDPRRDTAFSLYCLAINAGGFVAPLVCGTLGEVYGWHYGFGAAGVGMLLATAIYISGREHLPSDEIVDRRVARPHLERGDGKVVASLVGIIAITALYWAAQSQVWNVYPLWLRDRVDRSLFDLTIPVTWFQSLDTLVVLMVGPALIWLWRRQSARGTEPSDLSKIAIGCAAFVVGCLLLSASELLSGGGKVGLLLPTLFHFMGAVGYLYVWPITFALVSRAAPPAANAMMLGACYLAIFVGGVFSGWLGRFYEVMPAAQFWLLHAAVAAGGVVLILGLRRPLVRRLEQRVELRAGS